MFRKFKAIIKKFDDLLFDSRIQAILKKKYFSKNLKFLESNNNHLATIFFSKDLTNPLSELCDKYGSDKGELNNFQQPYPWPAHSYSEYYSRLFGHCRFNVKKVFECGIGTSNTDIACSMGSLGHPGASLRVWRDYFPNAIIYGGDIDENILFTESRIKTFFIDQLDPTSIKSFWEKVDSKDFDFIVDDGLHTFQAGITLFKNSVLNLSKTGIYVIEDVNICDLPLYLDFFVKTDYIVDYVALKQQKLNHEFLIIIRKKQLVN